MESNSPLTAILEALRQPSGRSKLQISVPFEDARADNRAPSTPHIRAGEKASGAFMPTASESQAVNPACSLVASLECSHAASLTCVLLSGPISSAVSIKFQRGL